ncbi:MAG: DUF3696 domain-containing protein [Pseudomonadota bacterium]|nr:DUF3696 domain-containing protein [Pseudomonadota bacterium]
MLRSMQGRNFKSWADTGNIRLAPITAFFGANSSGKTSLLQLLLLLKQTVESTDRAQVLDLGDERSLVNLGGYQDLIYRHDKNEVFLFGIDWDLPEPLEIIHPEQQKAVLFKGNNIGFSTEVDQASGAATEVHRLAYRFSDHEFALERKSQGAYSLTAKPLARADGFAFQRIRGRPWDLPPPVKCYGFPDQARTYFQNAGFLADLERAFEDLFANIHYLGPLREFPKRHYAWAGGQPADMGRRGERVIDALLASRNRKPIGRGKGKDRFTVEQYVAWWLKKLGLIDDFSLNPVAEGSSLFEVLVKQSAASADVLITDVGFGVSQILPVLTLCYYVPEGSVLILEQPEIHLHPRVQAGLADVFIDAVKTRKVQILLESHSEHLLRRLQRRIAEEELDPDCAALYFCDMKDGQSRLHELQLDEFGNIVNWPENFFGDDFGEIAAMTRAVMERKKQKA